MTGIVVAPEAARVMRALRGASFSAYAVGGCVRDSLLGLAPSDWDVCTSARPERVVALFGESRCLLTGLRHGTVTVREGGALIEVTTFRAEGAYSDGRHPDRVDFIGDVYGDLARRDFTVNAMAYCDEEGLIDPFGGREDLRCRVLRAVGEARERFAEDALRILRLFRFGARLGFSLDAATREAALALCDTLRRVSAERIVGELSKLLPCPDAEQYLPEPLLRACLPLAAVGGGEAVAFRLRALRALPPELPVRLAALLGACEACDAEEADKAAREAGLRAREALVQARWPGALCDEVALLVRERALRAPREAKALRVAARRALARMTLDDLSRLCTLRQVRIAAGAPGDDLAPLLAQARACARSGDCVSLRALAVNGRDLRALGASGRRTGEALALLLSRVMEEELPNERDALLAAAREMLRAERP